MSRSDLILGVVRSAQSGDRRSFERSVQALIVEERAKQHGVFAERLEDILRKKPVSEASAPIPFPTAAAHPYWLELEPKRTLNSLVLPPMVQVAITELIEEHYRRDLLRSHGEEPKHRVLLTGAPGNGKTTLAEAIATELMVPLVVPRYESLIGSYLGETASRLGKLFEQARCRPCVLFLDEFDTLGRERADPNETGEIKRVVSSLLLQIDALPSHVVTVVATNHPETLDRAVWRRFQLRLELPSPTRADARRWFERWSEARGEPLGLASRTLAEGLRAESYAELEEFVADVHRRLILSGPEIDRRELYRQRLRLWQARVRPPTQS